MFQLSRRPAKVNGYLGRSARRAGELGEGGDLVEDGLERGQAAGQHGADQRGVGFHFGLVGQGLEGRGAALFGGEGLFFKSPSVAPDNDGTILVRSGGSRYLRNYSGYIDPRWFGVVYGVAADQMTPLAAALAVGPVQIAGLTYIGQDRHLGGTMRVFSGGFYSNATPKLYLDGRLEDACPGAFGAGMFVCVQSTPLHVGTKTLSPTTSG